jgi:NADPH:quinone reductase-like Zn-dependent oxidoreductase
MSDMRAVVVHRHGGPEVLELTERPSPAAGPGQLRRAGDLFSWISQGQLSVRVGATYALEKVARANEDLGGRRTTGKLLLLPNPDPDRGGERGRPADRAA